MIHVGTYAIHDHTWILWDPPGQALQNLPGGCTDSLAVGFSVVNGIEGHLGPKLVAVNSLVVFGHRTIGFK